MDAFSIDVKDISYLLPHDRLLIAVEECTGVSVCILPVYEIVKEMKSVEYRTSFHVSWNGPVHILLPHDCHILVSGCRIQKAYPVLPGSPYLSSKWFTLVYLPVSCAVSMFNLEEGELWCL